MNQNLPIFLDFEASSLSHNSHPIEVAWSDPTGKIESFLIKPEPDWTDWDDFAELAIHKISRDQLEAEGVPASVAVERMTEALSGHTVYTSDASFDSMWCDKLFDHNGYYGPLPFKFGEFKHMLESHFGVQGMPSGTVMTNTRKRVRDSIGLQHRAAADAQYLRDLFVALTSGY